MNVGAGAGGVPNVIVFSGADTSILYNFLAYDIGFYGGVQVGAGRLNNDGTPDFLTGPGAGGGPDVEAFNGAGGGLIQDFFGYDIGFTGGV